MSQGFGTFEPNLTLGDVCSVCNKAMGREIETPGIRGSVEGVHRFHTSSLRNPKSFAKTPSDRVVFEMEGPEWEGARVFIRLMEDGNDVEQVLPAQVRITFKNGRRSSFLLGGLPERLDRTEVDSYRIFGQTRADLEAVAAALAKLGVSPRWQEPIEERPSDAKASKVTARAVYDDISRRLAAKIAFNYLASVMGAPFALKEEFDDIRRFIRCGKGQGVDLVESTLQPFLREEKEERGFRATDDHLVAIRHSAAGGLVAHISLFNMIHNRIVLSRTNPERFFSGLLPSGRSFDWRQRVVRPMLHVSEDNLVQPLSVLAEKERARR